MSNSSQLEADAWQAYLAEDISAFPFRMSIVAIVVGTVVFGLRLWARRLQDVPYGWDDWFIAAGYVSVIGSGITGILCVQYGTGRHIEYVLMQPPENFKSWGILNLYITVVFWLPGVTFPKLSLLVLFLRIFTDRFSRWCCYITITAISLRVLVDIFTIFLQCGTHPEYAWQPAYWPGNCSDILAHYAWGRLCNILSDLVCVLLPLPAIWRLRLQKHVKLGVAATFFIGGGGLVAAILSMLAFMQDNVVIDSTWVAANLVGYSLTEQATYFVSVCLVSFRPLLTPLMRFFGIAAASAQSISHRSYAKPRSTWDPPVLPFAHRHGVFTEIRGGDVAELRDMRDSGHASIKRVQTMQVTEVIIPPPPVAAPFTPQRLQSRSMEASSSDSNIIRIEITQDVS